MSLCTSSNDIKGLVQRFRISKSCARLKMLWKSEFFRRFLLVMVIEVVSNDYAAASAQQCVTFTKCSDGLQPPCLVKVNCFLNGSAPSLVPQEIAYCHGTLLAPMKVVSPAKCLNKCDFVTITYLSGATEAVPKSGFTFHPSFAGENEYNIGLIAVENPDCIPYCCSSCEPFDVGATGVVVGGTSGFSKSCCATTFVDYRQCQDVYGDEMQPFEAACENNQCNSSSVLGVPTFKDGKVVAFSTNSSKNGNLSEVVKLGRLANFVNFNGIDCQKPPFTLKPDCDCPDSPPTTLTINADGTATCPCLVVIEYHYSSSTVKTSLGFLIDKNRVYAP